MGHSSSSTTFVDGSALLVLVSSPTLRASRRLPGASLELSLPLLDLSFSSLDIPLSPAPTTDIIDDVIQPASLLLGSDLLRPSESIVNAIKRTVNLLLCSVMNAVWSVRYVTPHRGSIHFLAVYGGFAEYIKSRIYCRSTKHDLAALWEPHVDMTIR